MSEFEGGLQSLAAPSRRPAAQVPVRSATRLNPAEAILAVALAAAGAVVLIRSAIGAYLYAPVADVIDWAARVFQAERDGGWLDYVWAPHTAQRIPVARLVEAFDIEVARGHAPSYMLATALAWIAGLAALGLLMARHPLASPARLWMAALAALLATNVALAEDFAYPVFSVYLLVAGPVLAAAALLQLAPREGWGGAGLAGAIAFAALACGGNAAGLAVWPALAAVLLLQGRDRRQLGLLLALAVVVGIAIEAGLGAPSSSLGRQADSAGAHLAKIVTYFGIFAGLPWTRSIHPFATAALVGWVLWALAGLGVTRAQVRREDGLAAISGCGVALVAFAALTALMASMGRVDEMAEPVVPTRYSPFAILLQLGTLLVFARPLERAFASPWRGRVLAAVISLLVLSHDLHGSRSLLRASTEIRAASDRFDRTGVQDQISIHPLPARALAIRHALAARGLPH